MADRAFAPMELRAVPHSLEAEQSVLGAILLEPAAMSRVADMLIAESFYIPQHRAIYAVMYSMYAMSRPLDTVAILEQLKTDGVYDEAGGKSYLFQMASFVPSSANIEVHAEIVREKYYTRQLQEAAQDILRDIGEGEGEAAKLIDSAEQRIFDIRSKKDVGGLKLLREIITNETLDRIDKLNDPETRDDFVGIPTGIGELDEVITGLNKSDLIVLGARPGMGKTSFALNICQDVALKHKKTVAFFSLEMTRDQLAQRLIAREAMIESTKLRTGDIRGEEWNRLINACDVLSGAPIYFDESSAITVPDMRAKVRRLGHVDLVVIDYLQLMSSPKRTENRVNEISEITRSLKVMAKDLNVPVVICSQLRRDTEKGKSRRPSLTDLRESGSIEQDADIVLFLYREIYYQNENEHPEQPVDETKAECIVSKNRHGTTKTVELHWDGAHTTFSSVERRYDTP